MPIRFEDDGADDPQAKPAEAKPDDKAEGKKGKKGKKGKVGVKLDVKPEDTPAAPPPEAIPPEGTPDANANTEPNPDTMNEEEAGSEEEGNEEEAHEEETYEEEAEEEEAKEEVIEEVVEEDDENGERRDDEYRYIGPLESWDDLYHVKMNDIHLVTKLRSKATGLELIHAKVPGPHVSCHWIVPHKLENDLGVPHILQNMIWHGGSTDYPLPGLLQKIANQCFSSHLKSWAERDHSCYYMTCGGVQGFDQLLPVVFDHIFEPDLNEATFLQYVYQMEGNGMDYGNCLKETQEREKDPDAIATLELIKTVFGPESNYSATPTGSSNALRGMNINAVEMVKEFHWLYYHLSNCCLVICGDIGKDEACAMVNPMLDKYRSEAPNWGKPWEDVGLSPPIFAPSMSTVPYPSQDGNEKIADVVKIGILGPHSTEKINKCVAMRLALEYFVKGPLLKAIQNYVQYTQDPFDHASPPSPAVSLSVSELEWRQTLFMIEIRFLPVKLLPILCEIVRRTMENQVMSAGAFNQAKMAQVVESFYHKELDILEQGLADKITRSMVADFVYSSEDSILMFDRRVNFAYTIHHFISQPAGFWKYVIQNCLLDTKWVTVVAVPSKQLWEEDEMTEQLRLEMLMEDENIMETKRLAQRSKAAMRLRKRQEEWDVTGILERFPLPVINSMGSMTLKRHENPKWARDTLCNFYFDDIQSDYVFLTVMFDTAELSFEEKKYLVLFAEAILNSPFMDVGEVFRSAEELRSYLQRDCLKYDTLFGLEWQGKPEERTRFSCGSFPHLFCIRLQLHVSKVKEGFHLCQAILWHTRWNGEKLKQICQRLVKEVDEQLKFSGPAMIRAMLVDALYIQNSVPSCVSLIKQKVFLRRLGEELPKSMGRVSKVLDGMRKALLRPQNCTVHVAGSLSGMEFNLTEDPNARDAVRELFRTTFDFKGEDWGKDTKKLRNNPDMKSMKSPECIVKCSKEQILRMDKTNVCYLLQASACLITYQSQDYAMILLASRYFVQDSGPLKLALVGEGLAKEIDIRVNPSEGRIYFELRHCPNLAKAYGATFEVIAKHCEALMEESSDEEDGEGEEEETITATQPTPTPNLWVEELLTSAKSSIIFSLTKKEDTPVHLAMFSLSAYYNAFSMSEKYKRLAMKRIAEATMEDVQTVTEKYLRPLFLQPCTCAASAPKDMAIPIINELMDRCGKRLTLTPPPEQSCLASFHD